jgi:mycothiol synthase
MPASIVGAIRLPTVSGALAGRPYTDEDLPRLQADLASWRKEAGPCGYCHVGDLPDRIYAGLRDRHPIGDLVRVWEDATGVAGIAVAFRLGSAFDAFTAPRLRGNDAEAAMLRWAGRTTRQHMERAGHADQPVVTDVFGCDGGRATMVRRLGYRRFRLFDHIAERSLRQVPSSAEVPAGFMIRPATVDDAEKLAAARNSAFGSGWSRGEYARAVMSKPGYDADREIVAVAPDGRVAAFTVIWLDPLNRVGHFEPVGTDTSFRRRGLARAAMLEGLARMQASGMRSATVEYDATNEAAAALYAGLGFVTRFETFGYRQLRADAAGTAVRLGAGSPARPSRFRPGR